MENINKNISRFISYKEATFTQTGLNNTPNETQLENMIRIAEDIFEPIREHFGKPIIISSFFRSAAVNKKVGGSKTSQHVKGEAMDIDAQILGGLTNRAIFFYIKDYLLYDQLIWEKGNDSEPDWVHVSLKASGNRKQILKYKNGKYELWKDR